MGRNYCRFSFFELFQYAMCCFFLFYLFGQTERVLLNKAVNKICQNESNVEVTTADGSKYEVGADTGIGPSVFVR